MAKGTAWETIRGQGGQLVDELKRLVHEGNVRRVVVRQKDRVVAEFPLTVGVVGTVAAPVLAAVGAIAALLTNCSIEVQRAASSAAPPAASSETPAPEAGSARPEAREKT